jgi:hypothetical protein
MTLKSTMKSSVMMTPNESATLNQEVERQCASPQRNSRALRIEMDIGTNEFTLTREEMMEILQAKFDELNIVMSDMNILRFFDLCKKQAINRKLYLPDVRKSY